MGSALGSPATDSHQRKEPRSRTSAIAWGDLEWHRLDTTTPCRWLEITTSRKSDVSVRAKSLDAYGEELLSVQSMPLVGRRPGGADGTRVRLYHEGNPPKGSVR